MAITYNWSIADIEYQTATGGVTIGHWRCTAVDGDHTASAYGTVGFTPDPTDPDFTPYNQVTEAEVLTWCWGSVDKNETEANLASQIDTQKNPVTTTGTPWG